MRILTKCGCKGVSRIYIYIYMYVHMNKKIYPTKKYTRRMLIKNTRIKIEINIYDNHPNFRKNCMLNFSSGK